VDLFNSDPTTNILPFDGEAIYYGLIIPTDQADKYYQILFEQIEWRNDESFMFGRHFVTKRKVAWYGDHPYPYRYSNATKIALPWTEELKQIKSKIEEVSNETYNSCLLNLYHTGEEGMGWHSDGEPELKKHGAIASVTLGAERKFAFKHKKTKETHSVILQNGSLLVMKGACQENWKHRLPPTKKVKAARVNLTFRTIENFKP